MKTLKIYGDTVNERYIDEAVDALRDGALIIYPTDSLYALGCDALNNRAIEHLCRLKDIDPKKQRLAITCTDLSQAARYAKIDNDSFDIMRRNLPGPFTFILPAAATLPKVFKGRKEVGIRVPDDAVAQALADRLGNPLLTTTLHLSDVHDDEQSEVAVMELADKMQGDIEIFIDAGARGVTPTCVVDLTDPSSPEIIREGLRDLDY